MVYGNLDGESMTAEIQCLQKLGITLLGVAGNDNEATWEMFNKLKTAQW